MRPSTIPRSTLDTPRLRLRPTSPADAQRAFEIQTDWDVTRMLSHASFPPSLPAVRSWFSIHETEWAEGTAYRFAIENDGHMIGIVDVDEISGSEGSLGYWLEKSSWGRGFAFEAAERLIRFVSEDIGLSWLTSGRADDNPASGHVLTKLGFINTGSKETFSNARGGNLLQQRYALDLKR